VPLERVLSDANGRLVELNSEYQELVRTMEGLLAEKEVLVEQLREANAHLEDLASRDGLTRLLNRRAFFEAATRAIDRARREREPLALVLFDIDHFKSVNDKFGHPVGDEVLRAVATAASETVRAGDLVGRYGGEEFAVVLAGADSELAVRVTEALRTTIAERSIDAPHGALAVTASFGIALHVRGHVLEELIKRADLALYEAKRAGRNRVVMG